MAQVALITALVLLVPALWVARKATLRRLALRNVVARPAEAVLVTVGTMLGTAIIVASFAVGDTIREGIGGVVDTSLGPIDESVVIEDPDQLLTLHQVVSGMGSSLVDGVVPVLSLPTAVTTVGVDPIGEPDVWIAEIDFDEARVFGGDPETSGFATAGATPTEDEAVVISSLASRLALERGDQIEVHAYGTSQTFTVRQVVERYSAAGYNAVYLPAGTIAAFAADAAATGQPPRAEVLVSNSGGWTSGAGLSEQVVAELEEAVAGLTGVQVEPVKSNLLDQAAADGNEFTTLFNGIGAFAVIAGILLIVNLFVMLAEERKTSLGVMRAIGFSRAQVTKSFAIEGAVYAATASVVGVASGIGIGWVLVQVLESIFFQESSSVTFTYAPQLESMLLAAALGLGITMLTIWATATRISQFNVIAAVRDLPQPPTRRGRVRVTVASLLGVAAGAGLTFLGVSQEVAEAAMAGVPLAAFSMVPLVRPWAGEKITGLLAGVVALTWGILVFSFLPDVMREAEISVFVVQGVVLVAGAVTVSASAAVLWSRAVDLMSRAGSGLSSRLGLVYPLARKGRTGLLLGMFSLVVFTITFLAVFAQILSDETRSLADDSSAGYDIIAVSTPFNPASAEQVQAIDGVDALAPLAVSPAEFIVEGREDPLYWRVTGFDETLLQFGTPALAERLNGYETDRALFEAVAVDPKLLVVDEFFLDEVGGQRHGVGDEIVMLTGEGLELEMTIAGVLASDFTFAGSYASEELVAANLEPRLGRYYVSVSSGDDAENVAGRLNAQLISHGMSAETFDSAVEREVSQTLGIFRLFQGFLSLGLLIGIAGLAVVLVRAVRERRRAIGVLRSLGAQSKTVRRSFLIESAFVAIQGVVIGAVLGLVTAYQVIVNSDTFETSGFEFSWPWLGLAFVVIVPTVAALLAAVLPARRAAQITPAVALRTE